MRLPIALLLAATAFAAGCGQVDDVAEDAPGGSTQTLTQREAEPPSGVTRPPDLLLVSEAGTQVGVLGSYCVDDPDAGAAVCADGMRPEAKQASIVRPGETVTIALDGARAIRAEGCHARDLSCIGEIRVAPLGCRAAAVARIVLEKGPETEWTVNLEPGAYELQVYAYFEADDGRSGDVSAALGIVVAPDEEPEIIPAPAAAAVCP